MLAVLIKSEYMFPRNKINRVFRLLAREYLRAFSDPIERHLNNPAKQCFVLKRTDAGLPEIYVNVMASYLSNGWSGSKTIYVNEALSQSRSKTVLYAPDGRSWVLDSTELTAYRCAMMAALAVEQFFQLHPTAKIGLIGLGRINLATANVFHDLFGTSQFVVRGSSLHPSKNINTLLSNGYSVEVDSGLKPSLLRDCSVVISCTNTLKSEDVIHYDDLSGPDLFIAQDSGYIFGPSFRKETTCYSDFPEQLLAHFHDEFPWDSEALNFSCLASVSPSTKPNSVYLYGLALADLVMAMSKVRKSEALLSCQ